MYTFTGRDSEIIVQSYRFGLSISGAKIIEEMRKAGGNAAAEKLEDMWLSWGGMDRELALIDQIFAIDAMFYYKKRKEESYTKELMEVLQAVPYIKCAVEPGAVLICSQAMACIRLGQMRKEAIHIAQCRENTYGYRTGSYDKL